MSLLESFARTIGFVFAAGVNLYATVAILGLASRYEWVDLPPQYRAFDNDWIIGAAVVLYLVEFVADKIPWLDTVWDVIHTAIRPVGGAVIAVAAIGDASPTLQAVAAIVGGALASSSHAAKASTRVAVNTSREPLSNWMLSLFEDGFVVALSVLALTHPLAAGGVVVAGLFLILAGAVWLVRRFRRRSANA